MLVKWKCRMNGMCVQRFLLSTYRILPRKKKFKAQLVFQGKNVRKRFPRLMRVTLDKSHCVYLNYGNVCTKDIGKWTWLFPSEGLRGKTKSHLCFSTKKNKYLHKLVLSTICSKWRYEFCYIPTTNANQNNIS